MTLGDNAGELRTVEDEVSEGITIRLVEISVEENEQLSPGERVERAIAESGDIKDAVYYDGGVAFMNVSSPVPEDLTAFMEGVKDVMRSMKESLPSPNETST